MNTNDEIMVNLYLILKEDRVPIEIIIEIIEILEKENRR